MPIDGLVLTAAAKELHARLHNARIQGVFQPHPDQLIVHCRQPGESVKLFASIHPRRPSIHLEPGDRPHPSSPPPFCLLLRKHLLPGRILGVFQRPFERIVQIRIEGQDDLGQRAVRTLVIELIGNTGNILLLDAEGTILDAMRRVAAAGSGRELLPHRRYEAPATGERLDPSELSLPDCDRMIRLAPPQESVGALLARRLLGFGPFAVRELLHRAGVPYDAPVGALTAAQRERIGETLRALAAATVEQRVEPTAVESGDRWEFWLFPIHTVGGSSRRHDDTLSLLYAQFDRAFRHGALREGRQRMASAVTKHLKRLHKKAALQQEAVAAGEGAEQARRMGDLLMAHLHEVPAGAASVTLTDFYTEKRRTIELDPALTPAENASRYYRRYQKLKKTLLKAGEQLEATRAEIAYLESVQTAMELAESPEELGEIEEELVAGGYLPSGQPSGGRRPERKADARKRGARDESLPPLTFRSSDGFTIRVGRNNRENDRLTMQQAKPDDLWFHVQAMPGAHVVVQTEGAEVPERTLIEAAQLAAYYSKARQSSRVPVDVAPRRLVRKPKGARPGMVIYDRRRTLYVTPDADLPRLLAAMSRR